MICKIYCASLALRAPLRVVSTSWFSPLGDSSKRLIFVCNCLQLFDKEKGELFDKTANFFCIFAEIF